MLKCQQLVLNNRTLTSTILRAVCALICNSLVSVLFLGSDNYFVMKHGTGVYLAEEDEIDLLQIESLSHSSSSSIRIKTNSGPEAHSA